MLEFKGKGIDTTLEEQEKELSRRDKIDSEREASPLKKDPEAIMLDTTNLSIQEQVEKIVQLYEKSKKDEIPLSGSRGHD
jgi:cytidylate kinase